MSERFDVFTFDEMHRLSCVCTGCGTEIIFDLANPRLQEFSNKCPSCQSTLYPMSEVIDAIRTARTKANTAKLTVKFSAPSSNQQ